MKAHTTLLLKLFTTIVFTQNITQNELISLNTKYIKDTQLVLKSKNYSYFRTINGDTQWKSKDGSGIIGSNGKGVVLLLTNSSLLYKKLIEK